MIVRAAIAVLLIAASVAAADVVAQPSPAETQSGASALDARIKRLETELRCLVCQNQTLADSNADLAEDLRREVRSLAVQGKSDDEIKAYLVARYGDFVLYNPPVKPLTWMLWFGPFALLAIGGAIWWLVLRRRATLVARATGSGESPLPAEGAPGGEAKARALLDEEKQGTSSS